MEKEFVNGLMFKAPRDNAPEFIKGSLSIKVDEFITYLKEKQKNGWVNIDLKESRGGKYYAELNTWEKPKEMKQIPLTKKVEEVEEEDDLSQIPF